MSESDVKALLAEHERLMAEQKGIMDEFRGFGKSFKEVQAEIKEFREKNKEVLDAVATMQTDFKKLSFGGSPADAFDTPEMKAFGNFIRIGDRGVLQSATKGASVNDARGGGVFAPAVFVQTVVQRLTDIDILRQYATVERVNGAIAQVPVDGEDGDGVWVGENEKRPDTDAPTVGVENIQMNTVIAKVPISNDLMQYGVINVEQYMLNKITERLTKKEGHAFTIGDGFKKPEGLFASKKVTRVKKATLDYDAMVDLWAEVPSAVDRNAGFVMNKRTAAVLCKLKSTDGVPLWNNPVAVNMPATFIGYPVILTPSAPDIGKNKTPVAYGDLKAYEIIDGTDMTITRDETSLADYNKTLFRCSKYVGGQVVMPSSLRLLETTS